MRHDPDHGDTYGEFPQVGFVGIVDPASQGSVDGLLTIDEVAAIFRSTPAAIYSQRHRRELLGRLGIKVGRRLLWKQSDLAEFLDGLQDGDGQ